MKNIILFIVALYVLDYGHASLLETLPCEPSDQKAHVSVVVPAIFFGPSDAKPSKKLYSPRRVEILSGESPVQVNDKDLRKQEFVEKKRFAASLSPRVGMQIDHEKGAIPNSKNN